MLLMLYDIIAGFCARQAWLPCKFFTLNSVTLTLLSIAAKLPVDLTTPMPGPQDQLSKLSGTVLVCISMGFLLPSVGVNSKSECFTNLVAMSIFIITIVANICIQIYTGVIVLFIAEHVVLLSCMLILLMMFWYSSWDINNRKSASIDENREIHTKGIGSMFDRLTRSYLFGYCSNPQLVLCLNPICVVGGVMCSTCSVVVLYAAFRSLILKKMQFCGGISDYDWSMSVIVVTQILTVVVGSFASMFRWLALSKHMDFDFVADFVDEAGDYSIDNSPLLARVSKLDRYKKFIQNLYVNTVLVVQLLIVGIPGLVQATFWTLTDTNFKGFSSAEWTMQKSMEDMKRWMDASKDESPSHMCQLLSRTYPSQILLNMEIRDQTHPTQDGVKVSSLSIVLLVRILQVSLPNHLSESLVQTFTEASGIIQFIDRTIKPMNNENNIRQLFTKAVWAGDDFNHYENNITLSLVDKNFDTPRYDQPQSDLDRALLIITKLKTILPRDFVRYELESIVDFIKTKTYSSIEDLGTCIEQMFVDMLHELFAQLPAAVWKILSDSPVEEYEERVKLALKLICKIESIETQIQWSFPEGCNITRLISSVTSDIEEHAVYWWS